MTVRKQSLLISTIIVSLMILFVSFVTAKADVIQIPAEPEITDVRLEKSHKLFKAGDTFSFSFCLENTSSQPSRISLGGVIRYIVNGEIREIANISPDVCYDHDKKCYLIEDGGEYIDCFDINSLSVVISGNRYTVSMKVRNGSAFYFAIDKLVVDVNNHFYDYYIDIGRDIDREDPSYYYFFGDHCHGGNHTYYSDAEKTIDVEPSCTSSGSKSVKCIYCGAIVPETIEIIPATGHRYDSGIEKTIDVEPSCTSSGSKSARCIYCGIIIPETIEIIPATGHRWSEWIIPQEETVKETGKMIRTCESCGKKQTKKSILQLSKTSVRMPKTKSTFLAAYYALGDSISVKSSSENIAKVSLVKSKPGQFKITAGKVAGKARITVTTKSGRRAFVEVVVLKARTTKITCKSVSVKKGKTVTLKPVVTPSYSDDKINYKSANKKIATVTAKGVVKGIKKGKTTITIKSGKKSVKIKVTVK